MKDLSIVDKLGLIPSNDKEIEISAVTNKTVLEYLQYLTSLMVDEDMVKQFNLSVFFSDYDMSETKVQRELKGSKRISK